MLKLILIFLGIILILIGYFNMNMEEEKQKPIKIEDTENDIFKNAGVGSSEEILKQRSTYENMFEQKPGEIFDNIFHGKIIGLLSS